MCEYTLDPGRPHMTMAHAHSVLENLGYKHTLIICSTYFFPIAIVIERTLLHITAVRKLPACYPIREVTCPCVYGVTPWFRHFSHQAGRDPDTLVIVG
jgi:hypothetical protein